MTSEDAFKKKLTLYDFRYHIHHPFDKLLQSGRATKEMLQMWAANRYYYQDTIPRKDAIIISKCSDSTIRAKWVEHILTHDVKGALSEWLMLTRSLGLDDDNVKNGKYLLPATKFACDAYYNFCRDANWQDGMCSSMTHLFAGDIHKKRIENWPQKYPWLPSDAFVYFTKRTQTLPSEIEFTIKILCEYYNTDEKIEKAVQILKFKQDVLWAMMDALWNYFFSKECRMPLCHINNIDKGTILRVLGSGAGGGVPQWNRKDHWNDLARHNCNIKRTQCSFAVTRDKIEWVLINCSPDFGQQWNDLVKVYPDAKVSSVILSDVQLDHITGLLSLRESENIKLYITETMEAVLNKDSKIIDMLKCYTNIDINYMSEEALISGISFKFHTICNRTSKYASSSSDVMAIVIGKTLVSPCIPELNARIIDLMKNSDLMLLDGTFARNDEMLNVKGHISIFDLNKAIQNNEIRGRTLFTHINNTNQNTEFDFSYDGMELILK